MDVSVILVDGSFRERFDSLESLAAQDFEQDRFEILWVEYTDSLKPELQSLLDSIPNARPIVLARDGDYHPSCCFNAGIRQAGGEVVAILDADLTFGPRLLSQVVEEHRRNERLACYLRRYNQPGPPAGAPVLDLGELKKIATVTDPWNHGAALTVRRKWLLEINGYDEHPWWSGRYHRVDQDVYTRLTVLGLDVLWHPSLSVYHRWHPGTEGESRQHHVHHRIAYYRAQNGCMLPFSGIDSTLDRQPEPDLITVLAAQSEAIDMLADSPDLDLWLHCLDPTRVNPTAIAKLR